LNVIHTAPLRVPQRPFRRGFFRSFQVSCLRPNRCIRSSIFLFIDTFVPLLSPFAVLLFSTHPHVRSSIFLSIHRHVSPFDTFVAPGPRVFRQHFPFLRSGHVLHDVRQTNMCRVLTDRRSRSSLGLQYLSNTRSLHLRRRFSRFSTCRLVHNFSRSPSMFFGKPVLRFRSQCCPPKDLRSSAFRFVLFRHSGK